MITIAGHSRFRKCVKILCSSQWHKSCNGNRILDNWYPREYGYPVLHLCYALWEFSKACKTIKSAYDVLCPLAFPPTMKFVLITLHLDSLFDFEFSPCGLLALSTKKGRCPPSTNLVCRKRRHWWWVVLFIIYYSRALDYW